MITKNNRRHMEELYKFIQNFKVLYVEDDTLTREKLENFLSRKFSHLEVCNNGIEGTIKVHESLKTDEQFDLIIADIKMPIISGLEMVKRIRKLCSDIPVIFLTGINKSDLDLENTEIIYYFEKPLDLDNFDTEVDEIIFKIFKNKLKKQNNVFSDRNYILDYSKIKKFKENKSLNKIKNIKIVDFYV